MSVHTQLERCNDAELKILQDPSTSYWLKERVVELANRDPVDAFNDVSVLRTLQEKRLEDIARSRR